MREKWGCKEGWEMVENNKRKGRSTGGWRTGIDVDERQVAETAETAEPPNSRRQSRGKRPKMNNISTKF